MLLRLLPRPTASNPCPATILFTLPLSASPYTSKGLPLPTALTLHRSLCAQEDIECSNPLLGDKASWISGIVDEVTFCLQSSQITAHLIDGSSVALPITRACLNMLHRVIEHVQLSFMPPPRAVAEPVAVEEARGSSSKRSTSGLLLTLLSPLLHNSASQAPAPAPRAIATSNPSRLHRRQARSVLVDAYRRHVLPALKEVLPTNYLLWTVQGEVSIKQSEWECTKDDVEDLLQLSGQRYAMPKPLRVAGSSTSSLGRSSSAFGGSAASLACSSSSGSDDDLAAPTTPATSVWHSRESATLSPLAHLSSLPASSSVLPSQRPAYASLVSKIAVLAARLNSLRKLCSHLEREEGRRKWLEGMESSRLLERSMRRAASNSEHSTTSGIAVGGAAFSPIRRSTLRSSVSSHEDAIPTHPAMEAISDDEGCMADDGMSDESPDCMSVDSDEEKEVTLQTRFNAVPALVSSFDETDSETEPEFTLTPPESPSGGNNENKQLGYGYTTERVEIIDGEDVDCDEPSMQASTLSPFKPNYKTGNMKARPNWRSRNIRNVQIVA